MSHRTTESLSGHRQFHEEISVFLATITSQCVASKPAWLTTSLGAQDGMVCLWVHSIWTCQVQSINTPVVTISWQEGGLSGYLQGWTNQLKLVMTSTTTTTTATAAAKQDRNLSMSEATSVSLCVWVFFTGEEELTHRHTRKKELSLGILWRMKCMGSDVAEAPLPETWLWTWGLFNSRQNL